MKMSHGALKSVQGCAVVLFSILVARALAGCGNFTDTPGMLTIDPGRYAAYHCPDLAKRWNELVKRERDLRALMEKANESAGGALIGSIAYRTDYDKALGEQRLVQREAAEKKCELTPASYESDQTLR